MHIRMIAASTHWLVERRLQGSLWQLSLVLSLTNGVIASAVNTGMYLLLYPQDIASEWPLMLGVPLVLAALLTFPVVYIDHALMGAVMRSRAAFADEANRDHLTQINNRRGFENRMAALSNCAQSAFLLLDLDLFKHINDRHGHDVGDDVLVEVSQILRAGLRHSDVVGRIGGEEFAVFMADVTPEEAQGVAERLRRDVEGADLRHHGQRIEVTLSAGLCFQQGSTDFATCYRVADKALYRAKGEGRNRIVLAA